MASPNSVRTTAKPNWTVPLDFIPRFIAIADRKRMKPSQLLTQVLIKFFEENE